ncbi:MAG: tyrosine--tRNA ligase [Acidobacteria bacterium]|nr:tyrosine--tRNA ligase [Acidobacteriota bacterium]
MTVDQQLAYLTRGCVDIVRLPELKAKLERSVSTGQPLVVKVGFDPTAPDLHLGHTVLIRKMKHFQDLGHRIIFLIGDFTGLIGDPTGRSRTRPPLSPEDIARNADTYREQVFHLLDPEKTEVEFNARWLSALGADGLVRLAARYNVAQMLERRDFRQRFDAGKPIAVHEFLYPLAQAYDSVHLKADVELGGTDQLFNLNVGRDIMPGYGLEAQVVMTVPLLEGLDGVEKMSKSLNNYVGITEAPGEMFGKLMSISDDLMWRYHLLLTDLSEGQIAELRQEVGDGRRHPKQVKIELATRIVADFHGPTAATAAAAAFEARFSRGELAVEELPQVTVACAEGPVALSRIIAEAGLAASSSEATRKAQQGGVRIDGERVTDARLRIGVDRLPLTLEVGRRAVRVVAG